MSSPAPTFDPQNGEICIGDTPLPLIGAEQLQRMVAPVFQDNYLFSGTLADNVRIARPDATDADLDQIAELAGLTDVITALPDGWHSQVGEGGTRPSGGEQQRVAIARAFLKDPPSCSSTKPPDPSTPRTNKPSPPPSTPSSTRRPSSSSPTSSPPSPQPTKYSSASTDASPNAAHTRNFSP
jgi:hypothetical protein